MTGEELKSWRIERNQTQEELGNILGVANNSVFRWEAGLRKIPSFLHLALEAIDHRKGGEKKDAVRAKTKRKVGS
jgi:transcriptional regulator with XRE-family HTH domain